MNVRYVCYPVKTLGPGDRLGIWLSGCARGCPGCLSPELQEVLPSDEVRVEDLLEAIMRRDVPIDGVTISGGEPFEQPVDLAALLKGLSTLTDDIIVYTGYKLEELRSDPYASEALQHVGILIDGPYVKELDDGRGIRGSSNQVVHRLREGDAFEYEAAQRRTQSFVIGDTMLMVGLR